jgi:hypothetical protein
MITLERALELLGGRRCGLVKFNIEGAEHEMLEAASTETLTRIEVLVGEMHDDVGAANTAAIVGKLRDCGFSVELSAPVNARTILLARRTP